MKPARKKKVETVTVTFGGKEYAATQLTEPEQFEVARIMRASREATGSGAGLLRELSEIVCESIRRAGSSVTVEEVTTDSAGIEILKAVQTLMAFTLRMEESALFDGHLPSSAKIQ